MSAKEANRMSQKLFPLSKMGAKHKGLPIHHKTESAVFFPRIIFSNFSELVLS